MKLIFVILTLLVSEISALSQCTTSQSKGATTVTYFNKFEEVYVNKDLENGLNSYRLRLVLQKSIDSKIPDYYMLECANTTSSYYSHDLEVVPRSIMIRGSSNELPIEIIALKEGESLSKDGFRVRYFSYELNAQLLDLIKKSVSRITFFDRRKSRGVDATPYTYLLSEQLECLHASSTK